MTLPGLQLVACGGATLRGGEVVEPGFEPEARVIATFVPTKCRDALGVPVEASSTRLFLLEQEKVGLEQEKVRLLAEARGGQAVLLVSNAVGAPRLGHFQVLLEPEGGRILLVDYKVGTGKGHAARSYTLARRFRVVSGKGHRFHAEYETYELRCDLTEG